MGQYLGKHKLGMRKTLIVFALAVMFFITCYFMLPLSRMDYTSIAVLFASGTFMFLSYALTRDFASPQMILTVTWTISLFLTSLDVHYAPHIGHFNTKLDFATWATISLAFLMFFIFSTIGMASIPKIKRQDIGIEVLSKQKQDINKIAIVSFLIAGSIYAFAVLKAGGIPAFSDNVNEDRQSFVPGTLGIFLVLFQLVVILAVVQTLLHGIKNSLLIIGLAFLSLIFSLLTTQRIAVIESVFMAGFLFIVLWPYLPKLQAQSLKKPLGFIAFGVFSLFVWGFLLIGQARGLDILQMTDLDSLITEQFFIYFGGPAPRNLQMIMEGGIYENANSVQSGALFFRPIFWFMGFRDDVVLNDTFRGPNNATALFQYYVELGLAGTLLFPAFWGLVTGYFYGHFRRKPSLNIGVVYIILATCTYFFPLTERFSEPATFVKIVLFLLIITMCKFVKFNIFLKVKEHKA